VEIKDMSTKNSGRLFVLILSLLAAIHPAMAIAQGKPNIVLVFLDNSSTVAASFGVQQRHDWTSWPTKDCV